eukprot:m.520046 g.520046  ORF g.520046 m.520046 type:complete len:132 (-) comp57492_c1_seq7:1023-1418(-)
MAQRAANSRDLLLSVFRGFGQGWLFDRAQALGITCVHDLRTTHPETLGSVVTPQFARESQDSATRLLQSLLQNESDPTLDQLFMFFGRDDLAVYLKSQCILSRTHLRQVVSPFVACCFSLRFSASCMPDSE